MMTNRCVKPPGAFCKEPTRSNPHTTNDQVMGMVCRGVELTGVSILCKIDILCRSAQSY
jgi:hypothetical protein